MRFLTMALCLLTCGISLDVGAEPAPVRVSEVKSARMTAPIVVNGAVRARTDVLLPATVEGELAWVASEGSEIGMGEAVARIDDRQLLLRRKEQQLLADRARINHEYLKGEVQRLEQLQAANMASRTQLAELVSRRDIAANDLAVAQTRIEQLEEQLERTVITSPATIVVVERIIAPGEYARRGEPVVRVVDPSSLEVEIQVPVVWFDRVTGADPVTVSVAGTGISFEAEVSSIIRATNTASQTFTVLAQVPPPAASKVVAGQLAEVSVPLGESMESLVVPRDAVVLRSDGSYVWRIDENDIAERVAVRLGHGQGDLVTVSGALAAGDRIAVRGVERLSEGEKVNPLAS